MTSQNNGELDPLTETSIGSVTVAEVDEFHRQRPCSHAEEHKEGTHVWGIKWSILTTTLFVLGLAFLFHLLGSFADWSSGTLPSDPDLAAAEILAISPVIVRYLSLVIKRMILNIEGRMDILVHILSFVPVIVLLKISLNRPAYADTIYVC